MMDALRRTVELKCFGKCRIVHEITSCQFIQIWILNGFYISNQLLIHLRNILRRNRKIICRNVLAFVCHTDPADIQLVVALEHRHIRVYCHIIHGFKITDARGA